MTTSITTQKKVSGFFTLCFRRRTRSRPTVFRALLDYHFDQILSRERREWRKTALLEDREKRCKGTKPDGSLCCAYRAKGEEFCRHHG